jgi:O-antigen/teichoic acid export membrane protein
MARLKGLLGPAAIYASSTIASSAIPFLMMPVLTRHLSPGEYGVVSAFSVAVSVFGALIGLSVHGALSIRYFELSRQELTRYVGACLLILLSTTAAAVLLIAAAAPLVQRWLGIHAGWVMLAALVSGAQFTLQVQLALWQSGGEPLKYGALRLGQTATDALVSLVLIVGLGVAWQGRLVGIATGAMTAASITLVILYRAGVRLKGSGAYVKDALRYGLPLVAHVLGGLAITSGDKIVVGSMLSLKDLGNYTVAAQVAMVLNIGYDSVFKAFHPWVIRNALEPERRGHVVLAIYKLLAASTLAGTLFYVLAYWGYDAFVGARYAEGRSLLLPLVLACMIRCGYFSTAIFINVAGRNEHLAANSIVSGGAGLALAATLVPHMGVAGAAWGTVMSEILSFSLNLRSSVKVYPMPWSMPWKPR